MTQDLTSGWLSLVFILVMIGGFIGGWLTAG